MPEFIAMFVPDRVGACKYLNGLGLPCLYETRNGGRWAYAPCAPARAQGPAAKTERVQPAVQRAPADTERTSGRGLIAAGPLQNVPYLIAVQFRRRLRRCAGAGTLH